MRTAEVAVYSYSELSESAKETVKNWLYEHGFFWAEEAHASLRALEDVFPDLKIHSSCFSEYPEVDYGTGQIDDVLLELSGNRLRTWLINNVYNYLMERQPQGQYTQNPDTKKWAYKRRSRINYTETSCPFTGYCMDDDILKPIRDFIKTPAKNVNMQDIIDNCIEAWKSSVKSDVKSQLSDEYIAETCEANEYEFTENGEIF